MEKIKSRLPAQNDILPVLAVISFMVYGWTLVVFLWKVPSWVMYLTTGQILVVLAYSMTATMLESLVVLGIIIILCLLLPARWLRDVFITRGSIAAIFGLGTIMLFMYRFSLEGYSYISNLICVVPGRIGSHAAAGISFHPQQINRQGCVVDLRPDDGFSLPVHSHLIDLHAGRPLPEHFLMS